MKIYINLILCFLFIGKIYADDLSKVEEYIYLEKYDDALVLLKTLSDNGNIDAHKTLASIYVVGGYVKQDIKLAILYLNKAVDAGDSDAALTLLKVINEHGGNVDIEDIERISNISSKLYKKDTERILNKIKDKKITNYPEKLVKSHDKNLDNEIYELEELENRQGWALKDTNWGNLDGIQNYYSKLKGVGTGFFINKNGYVVTNQHVVDNCENIIIHTNVSTESALAKIIEQNISKDLALLKANKRSPMFLSISERKPLLGSKITVGGFPTFDSLGYSIKITQGILSGALITGEKEIDYLDIIDAAVQQGSSGSPVINENGNVVGVVVAIQVDRENQVEQTLNYIINWESLKKFLINSGIEYNIDKYNKKLSSVVLARQLDKTAVTVLCIGK